MKQLRTFILVSAALYTCSVFQVKAISLADKNNRRAVVDKTFKEYIDNRWLTGTEWLVHTLPALVDITDWTMIERIADEPASSPPFTSTISRQVLDIFHFSETPTQMPLDLRARTEVTYYRRILHKRRSILLRWLPWVDDYASHPLPSDFVRQYNYYANMWAIAVDKKRLLIRTGASQYEIQRATEEVEKIRRLWDTCGYRQVLTVARQRYNTHLNKFYASAWIDAEFRFEIEGAMGQVLKGLPAPVLIPTALKDAKWIQFPGGLETSIVRIERPWIDHGIIHTRAWSWSNSYPYPYGQGCINSNSSGCYALRGLVQRLVLARIPNESTFAIGTITENGPELPPNPLRRPYDEVSPPSSMDPRSLVFNRLRNNTF